ncbi:hypothetical protein BUALT_Bualt19G0091400 [Buddleja alternifolia]|uniref:BZIP domain-containing protein n=1 Tax=Buddleja alternifolia TaxID=168488 RepID=A0AAV6W2V2_9LAMI|nr:hypothetical protein BUALT_Bualt19G0091400 [Buddleja alternifolia]
MHMASLMASRSPPNPDPPRHSTPSPLNHPHSDDHSRGFGSMNMDDLLRTMYSDSDSLDLDNSAAASAAAVGGGGGSAAVDRNGNGSKTVDEVWREIVSGGGGGGGRNGEAAMTLEVFLAKAGAVNEEDVRVPAMVAMTTPPPQPPPAAAAGGFGMETAMMSPVAGVPAFGAGFGMDFGNGMGGLGGGVGGGGRGKRRAAVEEAPPDKATQQKQRRMIKNRESAARLTRTRRDISRCLHNVEISSRGNALHLLMENLIPVVEKRKPPKALRSVRSM